MHLKAPGRCRARAHLPAEQQLEPHRGSSSSQQQHGRSFWGLPFPGHSRSFLPAACGLVQMRLPGRTTLPDPTGEAETSAMLLACASWKPCWTRASPPQTSALGFEMTTCEMRKISSGPKPQLGLCIGRMQNLGVVLFFTKTTCVTYLRPQFTSSALLISAAPISSFSVLDTGGAAPPSSVRSGRRTSSRSLLLLSGASPVADTCVYFCLNLLTTRLARQLVSQASLQVEESSFLLSRPFSIVMASHPTDSGCSAGVRVSEPET